MNNIFNPVNYNSFIDVWKAAGHSVSTFRSVQSAIVNFDQAEAALEAWKVSSGTARQDLTLINSNGELNMFAMRQAGLVFRSIEGGFEIVQLAETGGYKPLPEIATLANLTATRGGKITFPTKPVLTQTDADAVAETEALRENRPVEMDDPVEVARGEAAIEGKEAEQANVN